MTTTLPPVALILLVLASAAPARADDGTTFRQRVAGIFERHCVRCHQGPNPKGGLSLASREAALAGGDSGPAIIAGNGAGSLLVEYISGPKPQMPKDALPLAADEIATLRQWIDTGTAWPAELTLTDKRATDANWWSLVPLATVAVPASGDRWIRTPVDAFILAKLFEKRLAPSSEADRPTLIRRLTFDLHGLPPTPAELDAFVGDGEPMAFERLVDRLLASPRYGERWGRYWLDVVHFGESHGYDKDKPRPNAWPYRDYVIASLNDDKPYDRFVAEQIAGDALWPADPQATVATGFVAAGPWDFVGHAELREGTVDKDIARSNDRDDMVANTASTFLSLTVHCARCHDHKFDPIKQQDYYGLQAAFAGVDRADREYGVEPYVAAERLRLAAEKAGLNARLAKLQKEPAGDGTGELAEVRQAVEEVNLHLAALPPQRMVYAAASQFSPQGSFAPATTPRAVHLLARGDVRNRGALMAASGVGCVQGLDATFGVGESAPESQRRAALARWLVDPRNALLRRSIVNRVWQYHFGTGIVDTPSDFGRMGSMPTHPELLDWLAGWFMDHGHSLKQLHRLLVTSAAYRQSSQANVEYARLDSGNRFLWRANRARLDAESIRDAMLAASGRLDLAMGGPSVQQFYFKDDHSPIYDYARFDLGDPRAARRSVYRFLVRSVPDPFMECLDCADPSIMTPKRNTTLTSIQALALLNNPFTTSASEHFAARLRSIASDPALQVEAACRLAFGRKPTEDEARELISYIARHGLANACRAIFNSNEFMFVD